MRATCITLVLIGIVLNAAIIRADPGEKESFYRNCVDQRIRNCELKASRVNSRSELVRRSAERAFEEGRFYRNLKEQLIQAMARQNVEEKRYKVDYFLIKAYSQSR